MNSTVYRDTESNKTRPRVYFTKIVFNDGTELQLDKNSIIVFTGANNCGKSQVLKDLERCIEDRNYPPRIVVKDSDREYIGDIDEDSYIKDYFIRNDNGYYELISMGIGFDLDGLRAMWSERRLDSELYRTLIHRLSTEERLTASNALNRLDNIQNHPICKLYQNVKLESIVSKYFHQAFGLDLIVNEKELTTIPLHVGKAPDKNAYKIADRDEYYKQVMLLPKLQDQGDGMRSFASILLNTFTSEYPITLIDEPEAFLHPPQARILGKILAKHNPENRQLFISTHSEDFLQGLIDADNENVTVIRIDRINNINKMSILHNERIRELWSNPILRYSNILSGIFHSKVVVCESDYDCKFYQAIIDAICEKKKDIAPDILLTHCGGKQRMSDIVTALKAVNVQVVAISDFDILDDSREFKKILSAFGLDWRTTICNELNSFYESINTRKSTGVKVWDILKTTGKAGLLNEEPKNYEYIEKICKSAGLFIVPEGEMECFDRTIAQKKKDWVYDVLERGNLATEEKLESARKFIQEVLDYKSSIKEEDKNTQVDGETVSGEVVVEQKDSCTTLE